jgi:C1A family cysteine protease
MRTNVKFGWRRDIPDIRDKKLSFAGLKLAPLPPSMQLEQNFFGIGVYDQGNLGSCTANAISQALMFTDLKQGVSVDKIVHPSRLFVYYGEREIEGSVDSDSGAEIRDGMKVVAQQGFPDESLWPYETTHFTLKPSSSVYLEAQKDKVLVYYKVDQSEFELKSCIADGYPFVFGISVYDSFMSANMGMIPLPSISEKLLGGHAIICTGYDDTVKLFTFRNSWGPGFGSNGSGFLPYDYLTNPDLGSDFWTVRQET